jgi:ATP/maltotriose-dependent transcriptional regulator MalT
MAASPAMTALKARMQSLRDELDKCKELCEEKDKEIEEEKNKRTAVSIYTIEYIYLLYKN